MACSTCNGSKTIDCPICDGFGTISKNGGKMKSKFMWVFSAIVNDNKSCPNCSGTKKVVCPTCGGSGK